MSFLLVASEILGSAAADITQIGSTVGAGNLAAAIPTTQLTAAAADEVSAAISAVFGAHARRTRRQRRWQRPITSSSCTD